MAPPFPRAQIAVDYPIYAVDFDPQDANKLFIGGGGGAGRSGVGNKITVLDTSRQDEVRIAGEADLSRDEDTVMSLAVGSHKGKATHVYAGINSSAAGMAQGENQHLRVFCAEPTRARPAAAAAVPSTPRAFPEMKIAEMSRTALFDDPDDSSYQRLLRVAGTMGAAASALGKSPQVAVFEATAPKPKVRGVLELTKEAEALDIVQTGADEFQLAYCHRYELYTVQIGAKKCNGEPKLVFSMPDDHGERPHFRSIRYLTPEFILALANLPKKNTGALIQGLRLPSSSSSSSSSSSDSDGEKKKKARLAVTARIPGKFSATCLAAANLSPLDAVGNTQFVVAVAGNNSSIYLYTVEHEVSSALSLLMRLHPSYTLKHVHGEEQISGLALSTFVMPRTHVRAQFIKLASTSLQKSVVVHNIPLRKLVDGSPPRDKNRPPRPVRYVVALRSRGPSARPLLVSLAVIVLLLAIVAQSVREMYGVGRPFVFAGGLLPRSWHGSMMRGGGRRRG